MSDWTPSGKVADYVQVTLCKSYEKELRSRLWSECPRPVLMGKVSETPEIDPTMVTFMGKFARDPQKGLDRSLKACKDKLLDLSGPLLKILEMGYQAKGSGMPMDPEPGGYKGNQPNPVNSNISGEYNTFFSGSVGERSEFVPTLLGKGVSGCLGYGDC